jgi:hypothetical protein
MPEGMEKRNVKMLNAAIPIQALKDTFRKNREINSKIEKFFLSVFINVMS